MGKIALILPGPIWSAPFVRIYTKILDDLQVDYTIISWNRDGNDSPEGIQFNYRLSLKVSSLSKLIGYYKFARFAKKTIRREQYDKLVVFCPQSGIFMTSLLKKYANKYIFDYRDLSIEQNSIFHNLFRKVLKYSYANVISSPGFKKALPTGYKYIISHNFDTKVVERTLEEPTGDDWNIEKLKVVLTIGGIRDFESNSEVIKNLGNEKEYFLRFVGRGISAEALRLYSEERSVKNIEFTGYYPKEEEPNYIKKSTFLNIFYPRILSHDTAISNRFYNSLIYKRPMLVTKNTTQGDLAEKYDVGIAVETCENVKEYLDSFLQKDFKRYAERCNALLKLFLDEQQNFYETVNNFCFDK